MGGMTPFKDTLTDDQKVAAVLTYVRQSPEWGNNAGPVTAEQVKAIRDISSPGRSRFHSGLG